MALTDTKIRKIKAKEKAYKLADEKGLFLLIKPNGAKYWRFKYRFSNKEKLLSIGIYPEVSLADARDKRDQARRLLANSTDPGLAKQAAKRATKLAAENSFEVIAHEWCAKYASQWVPKHGERIIRRFERDVFPWLGPRPIVEIIAPDLLTVLRRIENRGAVETAHRVHQNCSRVFRYAIATGRADRDPCGDLRSALPPVKQKHHASIVDPKAIGDLLRAIHGYNGYFVTKCALQLAPLLFGRPGELRKAEWSEINQASRYFVKLLGRPCLLTATQ